MFASALRLLQVNPEEPMMSMRTEMKCFARMAIAAILAVISTLAAAQSSYGSPWAGGSRGVLEAIAAKGR